MYILIGWVNIGRIISPKHSEGLFFIYLFIYLFIKFDRPILHIAQDESQGKIMIQKRKQN
jgi:hypothetical protein